MAKTELFVRKTSGGVFVINPESNTTGNIFFVDSGSSTGGTSSGFGDTPDKPLTTIDSAINRCTANNGDYIYVMAGHAETLSTAAAIDFDVAGITVVGLGYGTDRPTITLDAVAADIDIDAANTTIKNIVFVNDVDSLVAPLDVNAAHFTLENCQMNDDTAAKQTVRWILGDASADYLTVRNCVNHGSDTAGATAWITLNGGDHVVVEDSSSHGDFSAANIETVTAACTDARFSRLHLENANAVDVNIEGFSAQTGWISDCRLRIATNAQVTWVNTGGAMSLFENYGVNADGEAGMIVGTVSS